MSVTLKQAISFKLPSYGFVNDARFSPDGKHILVKFATHAVVWDIEMGEEQFQIQGVNYAFIHQDRRIASTHWIEEDGRSFQLTDLENFEESMVSDSSEGEGVPDGSEDEGTLDDFEDENTLKMKIPCTTLKIIFWSGSGMLAMVHSYPTGCWR